MIKTWRRGAAGALAVGVVAAVIGAGAGCGAPGGPDSYPERPGSSTPGGGDGVTGVAACLTAQSAEPYPARQNVVSTDIGATGGTTFFTEQLFGMFYSACGGCHVDTGQGTFRVSKTTFPMLVDDAVLARVKSNDPSVFMPPPSNGGVPFAQRAPTDSVAQLASLLEIWMSQGRPDYVFNIASGASDPAAGYRLSPDTASALTNVGNCVPTKALVATDTADMDQRDAFFAAATALPEHLSDTDLVSLDAGELARQGVVAYAPTYPLWTDNAGKMRFVRVPRGQSIQFDKAKQQFSIPANTRFYKTFLREVVDMTGAKRFKKMETRLIVARPDKLDADPSKPAVPQALFGTYLWNEDESEATLLTDLRRDGKPFTDRLITYTVDEPAYQAVLDSMPNNLSFALEVEHPGLLKHYAVPGSERCIQCHMGSVSGSFVLGFMPLQVARRPEGVGGVYEPAGADEMSQFQRLIDYGVVTGISSITDIKPLETSEGDRKPRNDYELLAQSYMLGNCAHCHNPRGYPSTKNPELKDLLDFLPSPTGGIFQFPLDRFSPVRNRGLTQDIPMPYITPSLLDYPSDYSLSSAAARASYVPKSYSCANEDDPLYWDPFCPKGLGGNVLPLYAPWRSLIFRNVDTPYTYADDFVVFPHMPMNSPGFDPRAPRILGDWMVSIPSALKQPPPLRNPDDPYVPPTLQPQPYVEVKPDDPTYDRAVAEAQKRLDQYHGGKRYNFSPDTSDIIDPNASKTNGIPIDDAIFSKDGRTLIMPPDGEPNHAHWVNTDLSEPGGDWVPRGLNWETVLVQHQVPADALNATALQTVVPELVQPRLTAEFRAFATTEVPFGLWQKKPGCDFSKIPKASDFQGDSRPDWMARPAPGATLTADPSAPIYMQAPGATVFRTICFNCHGPEADSKGIFSEALAAMTGGTTRVANFRDGILGPREDPGRNRQLVFGAAAAADPMGGLTADDFAARYLAFMALGGTEKKIPAAILNIVATTTVVGERRNQNKIAPAGSANMLQLATELCRQVLPLVDQGGDVLATDLMRNGVLQWGDQTGLIDVNGDAAMWQRLCQFGNRSVVRVVLSQFAGTDVNKLVLRPRESLYWGDGYPSTAPVMNHLGRVVTGVGADNLYPMCVKKPSDPALVAALDQYLTSHLNGVQGAVTPYCPDELFVTEPDATSATGTVAKWQMKYVIYRDMPDVGYAGVVFTDVDSWATRGAINAGFAVFSYLDQLERGQITPKPPFNHCEDLAK